MSSPVWAVKVAIDEEGGGLVDRDVANLTRGADTQTTLV
jgi:hypothetical protein